jgi:hypothetical protein
MIEMQLDVFNADFTEKVRVVDRLVFTPNSFWKIDSFRRATGEKIDSQSKVSFEAEDCVDRRGQLGLKTGSYNGRLRNEVDYYVEPEEGAANGAPPVSQSRPAQQPAPTAKGTVPKSNQPF